MLKIIVIISFILLGLFSIQTVEAQTSDSSADNVACAPPYPIVASANTGAGYINFCVYYPRVVLPGSTFTISSTLTAPTTVLAGFNTAASAFTAVSGCTEGTPVQVVPTTNGVFGTMVSFVSSLTMTSEQCDASSSATMQVAAAPIQIYNAGIVFNIRTENVRVDNFDYLCDAPGIAPNAYSTTATTCNDVVLSLSGTIDAVMSGDLTLSGTLTVSDDANGWIIHQDPISGELTICPETEPCFHEISGSLDTNGNITINGNFTGNFTDGGGNSEANGFNGSLYVLIMVIALALARTAETRGDNGLRAIAGFIALVAGFVAMWEMDLLGFNHLDDSALLFLLGWMGIHIWLGVYLMVPKDYEKV